jgi:large subunit ribosomal protein L22
MTKINYALENVSSDMVKAYGRDLGISTKAAINICNTLRGMDAQKALRLLDNVIAKRQAIAYTRFTDGVGHRKGPMAAGRFPVKAAQAIKATIKSAIANAANQGLAEDLKIVHICAHKAATPFHQGRQRRRAMKRSHVEVALKEVAEVKVVKKAAPKKAAPKKTEAKAPVKEAPVKEAEPATQSMDKQEAVTGEAK